MMPRHLLALFTMVSLSACGLGTISSIVPGDDSRFDARLVGTWGDSSGKESVTITGDSGSGYAIAYTDADGKQNPFEGQLGALGGFLVLDLRPVEPELGLGDMYSSLLFRAHAPVVIDDIGSVLRFRLLEPDSLKALLAREPGLVAHALIDDAVLLTAPTGELRRFLTTYLRRPGVLTEQSSWVQRSR